MNIESSRRLSSRVRFVRAGLLALALLGSPTSSRADELNVVQGFNFEPDRQWPMGCLVSLQIGSTVLAADIRTKLPTNPAQPMNCVAVLSHFNWDQAAKSPILIQGEVSTTNRSLLAPLAATGQDVTFTFVTFAYSKAHAPSYYTATFLSGGTSPSEPAPVKGKLQYLTVAKANNPNWEVPTPKNYHIEFWALPAASQQAIRMSYPNTRDILLKPWSR